MTIAPRTIACLLVCGLPAAAQTLSPTAPSTSALAKVGDRSIAVQEFRQLLIRYRKSGDQNRLIETLTADGRKKLLDEEIDRVRLGLAAREVRLDDDADVHDA